jgi:8-oxo-dGTP pyrophosphatase MutT (NUDIX family)
MKANKIIRPSVLLIKENKILVLASKYSSGEFYLLPGGGIDDFETLQETAIRETKEETNLNIKLIRLLYLQEWINKPRDKNVLYAIFLGKILDGKETHLNDPILGGHIKEIKWKTIDELKESTFFPKEALPAIEEGLKNNFQGDFIYLDPQIED